MNRETHLHETRWLRIKHSINGYYVNVTIHRTERGGEQSDSAYDVNAGEACRYLGEQAAKLRARADELDDGARLIARHADEEGKVT